MNANRLIVMAVQNHYDHPFKTISINAHDNYIAFKKVNYGLMKNNLTYLEKSLFIYEEGFSACHIVRPVRKVWL